MVEKSVHSKLDYQKSKLKWSIGKKMSLLIIAATIFSLLMGAPITYIQFIVFETGMLDFLGNGINTILRTYFTLFVNLLIMVTFVGFGIKRFVIKPIRQMEESIAHIHGDKIDLTQKINIASNDEFAELAKVFNGMLENLQDVISMVDKTSTHVSASTEEMAASSEEVAASAKEVSTNTYQLANKAEDGNEAVTGVSQALLELSSLIQIAKKRAAIADDTSQVTLQSAESGKRYVSEVEARMITIKERTEETKQYISSLDQYSKEITEITDMISDIAEQTNLLALNAAIEAARAGEYGKGFAVVASEVRKLAEQSTQRASKVTEVVNKITTITRSAVVATDHSRTEVDSGVAEAGNAGTMLDEILSAVKRTVEEIEGIVDITNEEVATSEKIVKLINAVASVIEETATNAEEVSAATEQTTASIDTITESTEQLNEIAAELRKIVENFKTD